ncbi:hypothetical protein RSAG8_07351, partial [Rhizoctonia solani AG-8 WAC10335]
MSSESDKAAKKSKRKEQDALNYQIAAAASALEERLNKDMETEAKHLGVEISEIRARFLMYTKMSEEEQDEFIHTTQEARKAKLNAGVAKTSSERFLQGTVKNEIAAICNRLDYLHAATSIKCLLFVVKGHAQDGLAPSYHASNKARTFLESHLKAPVAHLLDLMESSSIGGGAALVVCHQNKTQAAKSQVRRKMLASCRNAVTTVAEDGSPPVVTNPLDIGMVEYKNYLKFVQEYKVVMEGWLFKPDGSLVDPSSMGLGKLEHFLKLLENPNSGCGFRRLTENKWKEWKEKLEQDIEAGKVTLPTRKMRSDAGKKRKREISEMAKTDNLKQGRKESTKPRSKKASAPKAKGSRVKQNKSAEPTQNSSNDSSQEVLQDMPLNHLYHTTAPNQPMGTQDDSASDPHWAPDLPLPSEILREAPPIGPISNTQATFSFRAIDVHPAAPQWPANNQSHPSTPQARAHVRFSGAPGSPVPEPSTPQRQFWFVVNTPEQQAARANSPRRARSCSPATCISHGHSIHRNPAANFPHLQR